MKKVLIISLILIAAMFSNAQDLKYARSLDSTLSSPEFGGRGYVDNGEKLAAQFLSNQMKSIGVQYFTKNYFQPFDFSINTIQSQEVKIDNLNLHAGDQYLVFSNSPSIKGSFPIVYLPDSLFDDKEAVAKFFSNPQLKSSFVITEKRFSFLKFQEDFPAKGLIYRSDKKLFWHVSKARTQAKFTVIEVLDSLVSPNSSSITLSVKSKFIKKYSARNVIGYTKGKLYPDSFIVFTAHFDHLGKMGSDVYFPGANDNASGVSLILDLARHFSQPSNQPDYSVVYALVSGEEVGLLGSFYLADNPLFPLNNISSLINLDMVGTGSEGIAVINARVFPQIYKRLSEINKTENYLVEVKERGESCNSDHCAFYKKGIPSVFIHTMGKENVEYHTITDDYSRMTFTDYEDLFRLLRDYINQPLCQD
ncbi:MAG: M28 family peptidase [Bacteroidales bacterium]|nr:M28 family peptidase [Bacteroidales bacterium]